MPSLKSTCPAPPCPLQPIWGAAGWLRKIRPGFNSGSETPCCPSQDKSDLLSLPAPPVSSSRALTRHPSRAGGCARWSWKSLSSEGLALQQLLCCPHRCHSDVGTGHRPGLEASPQNSLLGELVFKAVSLKVSHLCCFLQE